MRVCTEGGCPVIYPKSEGPYCKTHRAAHERKRGSRRERGYDSKHIALRKQWAPKVATGKTICPKCGNPIGGREAWHLGHTDDRNAHTGPEHVRCNLRAAGIKSHRTGRA